MSQVIDAPLILSGDDPSTLRAQNAFAGRLKSIAGNPAVALTLLTAIGAVLRFWNLGQPGLWGDEVSTFRRVCGTFQQLVDQLAVGGFTPLHYLLYYWIGKHAALTPTMMRVPTAIFGTLMIPAMYFLARQLVRPPVAMLVAAFTACSAYQLNFARDAKMYSDLWLCGAVHMACLLVWLRTRSATAWWGWIAAGTAMMGVQFVGAALYPIELLIVLTSPRGNWRCLWPMTRYFAWWPVVLMGFPINVIRAIRRHRSGNAKILPRAPMRSDEVRGTGILPAHDPSISQIQLPVLSTPSSPSLRAGRVRAAGPTNWLHPFVWIIACRLTVRRLLRRRRRLSRFAWPTMVLFVLGLCIAGAAPYVYYLKFDRFFSEVYNADQSSINWSKTGITWVAGYNAGRDGLDLVRYTTTAYAFGWEWPRAAQWIAVDERTGKLLIGLSIALLTLTVLGALPLTRRPAWARRRSLLWIGMWIILPGYAFYCASMPNAVSPITWIEQLLLKNVPAVKWPALPVASSWASTWQQWRHTSILHDTQAALRAGFATVGSGFTRDNLDRPSIALLSLAVLAWMIASLRMNRRSLYIATQTGLTIVGLLTLCVLLRIAIVTPFPRSVWMPRYLAFIWPAFAILLAALFYRLPTRPIRWVGIAVLIIGNLSVYGARVLARSEPPTERMARDILDCQPPLHSRLFTSISPQHIPEPGTGVLESMEARYYLAQLSGKVVSPDDIRGSGYENHFLIGRPKLLMPLGSWATAAMKDASVNELIVWEPLEPKQVVLTDPLEKVLPSDWRELSREDYASRDHWTWTNYNVYRRHVYQKQ